MTLIVYHHLKVKQCDDRLERIHVPHDLDRSPKGLSQVKQWKGMQIVDYNYYVVSFW